MSDKKSTWKHAQTLEPEHWRANRGAILAPEYRESIKARSENIQSLIRPFARVEGEGISVLEIGGGGTPLVDFFRCSERHSLDPLAEFYSEQFGTVLDSKVKMHHGRAEELPFPDCSFDVVISRNVLDHVEDDRRSLSEIRRVLKPTGAVYLAVNNFSGPLYMFRSICKDPEHPYTYNHETLAALVESAGFSVRLCRRDPPEHMGHFRELESRALPRRVVRELLLRLDCYHYSEWILGRT